MNTYTTPAPITATLTVPAGRVQVTAADRTDTVVDVRPANPAKGRDVKAAEQATVEFADGTLQVRAATGNHLGSTGAIEVTIQLPAGSHLQVTAAATEFRAVGRLGDIAFEGAYRDIKIDEATSVQLTATDGDVEIGHLNGPADISTQRGDIRIAHAAGPGQVALRTQSGDITIAAAPGVSAALDAATPAGRISNSLKNDGTTELDVRATTSHGDITARSL
ncbi:DUF4097 family beta strand repeat-containing protein [Actinomadura sp. NPDC048394]|uniref:DUF4097 family beta strand repeat-containing protein n=1 Tax=Actinomadura sp. NPDC048394 TaxID=3158223 RepID=UPI0033C48EDD